MDTMSNTIPRSVSRENKSSQRIATVVAIALITLAGIGTGYVLSTQSSATKSLSSKTSMSDTSKGTEAGMENVEGKDDVEGSLVKGGLDGEGSHHLERDGGPSQYVYLISSVIDLDLYVDQKVHIWGDTYDTKKAGWFMDVVKLEVK